MKLTPDIYRRITSAKMFIDENYHEPINLELISKRALLSMFHFHRLFSRVYKITPHRYVTRIRLEAAKSLLEGADLSITEVCHEIGFESPGTFSTLFTRQNGCSPQNYRSIAWSKKKLSEEQPKRFIPHCFVDQYKVGQSS